MINASSNFLLLRKKKSLSSFKRKVMSNINLDAMIPKEDFNAEGISFSKKGVSEISLAHLMKSEESAISIYHLLRKPDFQRETNEWDKNKVYNLIDCFIKGRFIPPVILWKSEKTGLIYVIDGSHRLSALLAWINNDYGDKEISYQFFNYYIPLEELNLATEARTFIHKKIGLFSSVLAKSRDTNQTEIPRDLLTILLNVVWLPDTSVKEAENSFFMINQQGVALSPTEKKLCKSRDESNCIATRAIIKGGKGTQYWKNFTSSENKNEIQEYAKAINGMLFEPPYKNPVETVTQLSIGGKVTAAMPMVFDFMNLINPKKKKEKEEKDITGERTLSILKKAYKIVTIINAYDSSSLVLHPAVYFYTLSGKHQQSSFLAIAQLMLEYEHKKFFPKFIGMDKPIIRKNVEEFLVKHKIFIIQIIRKYGSKIRSYGHLKDFYSLLIDSFISGKNDSEVIDLLISKFNFLNPLETEIEKTTKKEFSSEVISTHNISNELRVSLRCDICGGYLFPIKKSNDHDLDKKYGGLGNLDNLNSTHFYCNSGYKNFMQHQSTLK